MVNKKLSLAVYFLVFVLSAYFSFFFFSRSSLEGKIISPFSKYKPPADEGGIIQKKNEPKTEACPLNGKLLTKTQKKAWELRRPLGIMVENHLQARPQSGLSSADVIYEAVAEGGITRFLSIFYCESASYVGPVRSARIYFLRLLQGYGDNPLYAHVGGANTPGPANALGEINKIGWGRYNDLNQFAVPFPYYWRDKDRLPGRATEHTMYSSTAKLWKYAKQKRQLTNVDEDGNKWDENFTPWKFKDDPTLENRGEATKISFGFWNMFASDYSVDWVYTKTRNSYLRNNGGVPHLDKNTEKALEAKNIIIVFAKESPANDGYEHGQHILYKLVGNGKGMLFQDGKELDITWKKKTKTSMIRFYNKSGEEVELTRGKIFVEILPIGNKVSY